MELNLPTLLFYGGAFDPPHNAHLELLKKCAKTFAEAKIKVFVDQTPPPLGLQQKTPTGFEERKTMVGLTLEKLQEINETTSASIIIEKAASKPQYAIDRLKTQDLTLDRPAWIFGDDQWLSFDKWKSWGEIASLVNFVVFPRLHSVERIKQKYEALFTPWGEDLYFTQNWLTRKTNRQNKPRIFIHTKPTSDVSSTSIRRGEIDLEASVPHSVATYIKENSLYNTNGKHL